MTVRKQPAKRTETWLPADMSFGKNLIPEAGGGQRRTNGRPSLLVTRKRSIGFTGHVDEFADTVAEIEQIRHVPAETPLQPVAKPDGLLDERMDGGIEFAQQKRVELEIRPSPQRSLHLSAVEPPLAPTKHAAWGSTDRSIQTIDAAERKAWIAR